VTTAQKLFLCASKGGYCSREVIKRTVDLMLKGQLFSKGKLSEKWGGGSLRGGFYLKKCMSWSFIRSFVHSFS